MPALWPWKIISSKGVTKPSLKNENKVVEVVRHLVMPSLLVHGFLAGFWLTSQKTSFRSGWILLAARCIERAAGTPRWEITANQEAQQFGVLSTNRCTAERAGHETMAAGHVLANLLEESALEVSILALSASWQRSPGTRMKQKCTNITPKILTVKTAE